MLEEFTKKISEELNDKINKLSMNFDSLVKPEKKQNAFQKFFFPDDTKLKIEASTDASYHNGKLVIHRKFYTFRAFKNYAVWYLTKNPYEKAKKELEFLKGNPEYAFRLAGLTAVFLLGSIIDIKNVSNLTLVAGAIAYDAQASTSGSTSPITFSHTTAGSDRGLVVTTGGLRNPTALTYNSVSMTEALSVTPFDTSRVEVWTLLNPASGTNTVSCTLASNGSTGVGAISFSGVDSFGNTAGSATSSDTTRTNTIYTKKANSMLVEAQWKDNASSITQNSSQTELFDINVGGSRLAGAYSQLAAAGGASLQFTGAGSASLIGHAIVEVIEKTATTTISLDATSQKTDVSSRETSFTWSHTCSGTNRVLVVNVFSSDRHPTGVTYNGDALTQIKAQANYGYQSTWLLIAPDTGANNIVVSFSSGSYCTAQAISLNGANGYGATVSNYEQDNSTNQITTSITLEEAGSWTIENQQSGKGSSGSGLTQNSSQGRWGQATHSGNGVVAGAYKSHSTSGSKSLSYSLNWTGSTEMQRHIIVEITAGDQLSLPTVTTQAVSSIDKTTATGNGNITNTGGEDNTKRGMVWDTTSRSDPGNTAPASSAYANYAEDTGTYSTGAFTKGLTGLAEGTTYYVRAYSYNSLGYSYGAEVSFKTDDAVQITKSLKYSVLVETSITKSLKYTVITEPSAITKSLKYTVVIEASAITKSLQYSVLTTPSGITKSLKYTVIVEISAITKSLSYEIITTPSAIQKSLLYAILTVPSALTKSLEYQVLVDTAITKSLQYTVEREVSAITKSLKYTVEITPSALTKSLEYVVVQRTSITKSLQYIVVAPVSITKSLKYTVTIEMSAITKSLVYAVRNEITAITKSMQYSVRSEASAITKSLKYTVTASASAITKDLNYIVFGRLLLQKSLQYSIQITPSAITKGLQYGILVETGITKSLKYVVGIETSVTKSLKYTVANNGIVITKSLQYAVLVRHRRNGSGYTRY